MAILDRENPTVPYLNPSICMFMIMLWILALGTVDQQGKILITIWGIYAGTYPIFVMANLAKVRKLSMQKFHESPGFLPARTWPGPKSWARVIGITCKAAFGGVGKIVPCCLRYGTFAISRSHTSKMPLIRCIGLPVSLDQQRTTTTWTSGCPPTSQRAVSEWRRGRDSDHPLSITKLGRCCELWRMSKSGSLREAAYGPWKFSIAV